MSLIAISMKTEDRSTAGGRGLIVSMKECPRSVVDLNDSPISEGFITKVVLLSSTLCAAVGREWILMELWDRSTNNESSTVGGLFTLLLGAFRSGVGDETGGSVLVVGTGSKG